MRRLLLTALLLPLAACGGSSDPAEMTRAGEKALGTQDFAGALADFEAALAVLEPSDPLWAQAKLGAIEALSVVDAGRARDELIALSADHPDAVNDRDFNRIAGRMGDAGKFSEAIALLDVADDRFPESEHLKKLGARLAEEAEKAGDADALSALAGLGYVGD